MELPMDGSTPASAWSWDPTALARQYSSFEKLEAQITELWGHLNAATYRFLTLLAEFDRNKAYERHGLVSSAQWLNWQCGIGTVAAREKVRTARSLERLPQIAASFERGEISYSKVRAMTRVATAANEDVLLNVALHGTASHVEKLVRKYRWTQRRDAAKQAQTQHLERYVRYFFDDTGALVLNAYLPAEIGMLVRKALEAATDALRADSATDGNNPQSSARAAIQTRAHVSAETWPLARQEFTACARRADGLKLLAESFLARGADQIGVDTSADRYQVVVHVDAAVLSDEPTAQTDEPHRCELDDGPALSVDTARRIGCDCSIVRLTESSDGEPLDIGRKTRVIRSALKRALRSRDGGCRFPGCDRTRFTDGHHVKHWADGGPTKLANLVTLCGFHHGLVHEGGFGVMATDDGTPVFTRPNGTRIPEAAEVRSQSFRGNISAESPRIVTDNRAAGLSIDRDTSRCRWLGEKMDYSMAIEGMQWCERAASTAPPR
jgi:predicted restriction endonuclease